MSPLPLPVRSMRAIGVCALAMLACACAGAWLALAPVARGEEATSAAASGAALSAGAGAAQPGQAGQGASAPSKTGASATLEQCATATIPQTERSATFAGEMAAIAGTARMQIRIDLQERAPGELQYRTVSAPGLGVWHSSAAGVKIFTHIQQVTDLSAPALYRGALRFRWVNAKGRVIKFEELHTARCEQPAPASSTTTTTTATSSSTAGAQETAGSDGASSAQTSSG